MKKQSIILGLLLSAISSQSFASGIGSAQSGGFSSVIIMMVAFMAIFYFMMIRPQMKRSKEHKNLLNNLAKGDEVVTTGGMIGKVTKVGDNFVSLTVSDKVEIKVQKQAITTVLPKGSVKQAN